MEQIQIRQPKMPAAQSFIQILWTFLAIKFNLKAAYLTHKKNNLFNHKTAKSIGTIRIILKKFNFIYQRKNITEN